MPNIVALLQCIDPFVAATTRRQFSTIISAILAMTGRVTMLGISRWAGQGGSYLTVQRFFYTTLPWETCFGSSFATICIGQTTFACWPVIKWRLAKRATRPMAWIASLLVCSTA